MINNASNALNYDKLLNEYVLPLIVPNLYFRDIIRSGCVCKSWRQILYNPNMWDYLLKRDWIKIPSSAAEALNTQQLYKKYASKFIHALEDGSLAKIQEKQFSKSSTPLNILKMQNSTLYSINSKNHIFVHAVHAKKNNPYLGKISKLLASRIDLDGKIVHIYRKFDSDLYLMVADQAEPHRIQFTNIKLHPLAVTHRQVSTAVAHKNIYSHRCIKSIENLEISGNIRGDIAIRNTNRKTLKIIHVGTQSAEDGITCLTLVDYVIYFGNQKGAVQMLDIQMLKIPNNQSLILGTHEAPITYLKRGPNILVSATDSVFDTTIKIWSTENFKLLGTLVANTAITFLKLNQAILFAGSPDARMQIWNVQTYEPMHSLNEDQVITTLLFEKNSLLAGTAGGRIQEWAEKRPHKLTKMFSKLSLKRKKK